jgi:hypothetical protein
MQAGIRQRPIDAGYHVQEVTGAIVQTSNLGTLLDE